MRLVILSNMAHYHRGDAIVGHGATVRELDHLATLFDEVVHVACLHEGKAPASALPYRAPNVRLRDVPPAGGSSLWAKVRILTLYPHYARVIWEELQQADAVHVRCPANLSLLAIVLLALRRHPQQRWIKYAGNWQSYTGEDLSYRLQRWWLQTGLVRGAVTVNGSWPGQPEYVHTFLNPCLTDAELLEGETLAADKRLSEPVRLLYVGRIEREKGVERCLQILAGLRRRNVHATLSLIGEGSQRPELEQVARILQVESDVTFHGGLPRSALGVHYSQAHFFLLPTRSEGWPKVLSEGMAYGAVPMASQVGSIGQYLEQFAIGRTFDPDDVVGYIDAIGDYQSRPQMWLAESQRGVAVARLFGYSTYLHAVKRLYQNTKVSSQHVQLWPTDITGAS